MQSDFIWTFGESQNGGDNKVKSSILTRSTVFKGSRDQAPLASDIIATPMHE